MKKFRIIITSILVLLTVVFVLPLCENVKKDSGNVLTASALTCKVGDIIEYGRYPQSRVTSSTTISALEKISKNWKSLNYYSGTGIKDDGKMQRSDYAKYADIEYNGAMYRAIYFTKYRKYFTCYTANTSTDNTQQYNNGYYINTTYYFKYEPLKWRVLDPEDGLVICESIIDSQAYQNTVYNGTGRFDYTDLTETAYANNYAKSSIRKWLNEDFYNVAFSASQKSSIKTTSLNNDCYVSSYPIYNSESTNDKIFFLSYAEAKKTTYGFSSKADTKDTARRAQGTDYAKCQGLQVSVSSFYHGNSNWLLRSSGGYSDCTNDVYFGGDLSDGNIYVYYTGNGVRPACKLSTLQPEHTHTYGSPTWTWSGTSSATATFTCSSCGARLALDSTISNSVTKTATCSSTGTRTYAAKVTFNGSSYTSTKTETIAKTSHTYGSPTWMWNGTLSAKATFRCSGCGATSSSNASISSSITKSATCTSTGVRTYTAKVNFNGSYYANTKTETIAKTSHTYGSPTWTWNGTSSATAKFTCSNCGTTTNSSASISSSVTKAATCTSAGTRTYTARVVFNGKTYTNQKTETIDKLVHNYSTSWTVDKNATCSSKGSKSHHCTRCSARKDVTEIPLSNHSYDSGMVTKNATCTADGLKTYTCTVCKVTKNTDIVKLGHNYSTSWTVDKKATCSAKGSKSHHCTRCSSKKDVTEIKVTAHKLKSTVTKATISKDGKIVKTCTVCKKTISTTVLPKIKTITLAKTSYTYDGKTKTPSVTVKDSKGKTLKKDTDYTVKYASSRKEVGTYNVKITFKGNYSGSKALTFKIVLGKVGGLKQMNKKGINFTWNKVTGATGYQVYAYDAKSKKYILLGTPKGNTLGNSSAKGAMKIKVRAYRKVGKNTYYGAYSNILTAKAK